LKALVSGATGFIGGALAAALADAGWDVNVLLRPGNRRVNSSRYQVFEVDLGSPQRIPTTAVEGCDVVFHAAAIRDRWGTSLEAYRQVNVEGTRRLIQAAAGRAGRFVYLSSVGVFGQPGILGIDETFPVNPLQGKVGYHSTKAEAGQLVLAHREQMGVNVVYPTIT
jgi:dihydroflavonol-4-reductase